MALFTRTILAVKAISGMQQIAPLALVAFLLTPAMPAFSQGYGSGWFDVSQGMSQAFGQQEALRDRMRMSSGAGATNEPTTDVASPGDFAAGGTIFQQAADALRHAADSDGATKFPSEDMAIAEFQASPSVREHVARRFAALLDESNADESGTIQALVASGGLSRDFDAVLDQFGFDKTNLAHIIAAYYIGMWEVANGESLSREQARTVCENLAPALVGETDMGALSDAQKQEVADTYILLVMLAVLNQQVLGQQDMSAFRHSVQQDVLRQGIDLYRLSVDDGGFTLR